MLPEELKLMMGSLKERKSIFPKQIESDVHNTISILHKLKNSNPRFFRPSQTAKTLAQLGILYLIGMLDYNDLKIAVAPLHKQCNNNTVNTQFFYIFNHYAPLDRVRYRYLEEAKKVQSTQRYTIQ